MTLNIPDTLQAGDSVTWTDSLGDYPASTYTLKYRLAGPQMIDITAAASVDDHVVTIAKTTTAEWTPGVYKWVAYVEAGSDSTTIATGQVEVLRDLRQATGSYEARNFARRVYDALVAVAENRASKEQHSMTLPTGVAIAYLTPAQLRVEILKWRRLAEEEEADEKRAQGITSSAHTVRIQFRSVT